MRDFFKTLFLLIVFLVIAVLFFFAILYTKDCIENLFCLNEYMDKIDIEKEQINNETELQTTQNQLKIVEEIKPIIVEKPEKNIKFGTLKIPSIDVELAMMNGTSKSMLSQGVGIDDESYFPGEGGSIILMGHNFKQFLARLPDCKSGDEVILETNYGEFHYTIYDAKVVKETDVGKVPVQNDEEILMIYTCWPIPNVTHANDRYVIYAR